jgi:hypothetical protein
MPLYVHRPDSHRDRARNLAAEVCGKPMERKVAGNIYFKEMPDLASIASSRR